MHVMRCGSGDPILFIHGMPTSGHLWKGVIEQLCAQYTCFAVDLPGFGKSRAEGLRVSDLRDLVEQLEEIRKTHGIEKWHVVGHDAGSVVAVHYAALFPERVDHLALLSPALFPELRPFYLIETLRKPVVGELLAPLVHALFWHVAMQRAVKTADDQSVARKEFQRPFAGPYGAWKFMQAMRWGRPAKVLAHIPELLPTLRMPTMIFQGTGDKVIPEAFARRAASLIPNASMRMLESGHFLPLHQPTAIAETLISFFANMQAAAI